MSEILIGEMKTEMIENLIGNVGEKIEVQKLLVMLIKRRNDIDMINESISGKEE
jgi:hypothetical protein